MELVSLVFLIHEELWSGQFDIWPSDGVVMFRHAIWLSGGELSAISKRFNSSSGPAKAGREEAAVLLEPQGPRMT
jgi:hypothetical protein